MNLNMQTQIFSASQTSHCSHLIYGNVLPINSPVATHIWYASQTNHYSHLCTNHMIYRNVQLPINPPVATMSVSMVNPPAQYLQNSPSHFLECFLSSYDPPVEDKFYTMFHGTSYRAAKKIIKYGFKQSESGMLGRGIYVSRNIQKAKNYPRNASTDQIILKLRVNVGRVKKIDMKGHALQYNWHSHHGYDTAWVPPNCGMVDSGMEEDCVWDPKRIKVLSVAYGAPYHTAKLERLIRKYN